MKYGIEIGMLSILTFMGCVLSALGPLADPYFPGSANVAGPIGGLFVAFGVFGLLYYFDLMHFSLKEP